MTTFTATTPEDTHALGIRLGELAQPGTVITLDGPLGAGKTALTAGIAQGAGVSAATIVNSPTYVLMNHYAGRMPIYHFDWYRLTDVRQLDGLDIEDFCTADTLAIIEWADKFPSRIPPHAWRIQLAIADDTTRIVTLSNIPPIVV